MVSLDQTHTIIISFFFRRFVKADLKKYCFSQQNNTEKIWLHHRNVLIENFPLHIYFEIQVILYEDDILTITVWLSLHDPVYLQDKQQLQRKRHIGNDIVAIVFQVQLNYNAGPRD